MLFLFTDGAELIKQKNNEENKTIKKPIFKKIEQSSKKNYIGLVKI